MSEGLFSDNDGDVPVPLQTHITEGLPAAMARRAHVAAALVCLYAFVIPIGPSPPYFVCAVLVAPALALLVLRPEVRGNVVLQCALAWIAFILALAVRAHLTGAPGQHLRAANNFVFLSLAPLIALQIAIAARCIPLARLATMCLASAVAGGALSLFWRADWSAGWQLFAHYVHGGGGANRNYLSIIAGIVILAAFSLIASGLPCRAAGAFRWLGMMSAAIVGVLANMALIAMQSRTNVIALTVALVVWIIACLAAMTRQGEGRTGLTLFSIVAANLGALAISAGGGPVGDRMTENGGVPANAWLLARAAFGQLDPVTAMESHDPRVRLFQMAGDLIAQKPLFGWGPDAAPLILLRGGPELGLRHIHNVYLELLVAIGAVGTALFILLLALFARDALTRRNALPLEVGAKAALAPFALAVLVYFAVAGLAESVHRVEFVAQTSTLLWAFLLARGSIAASIEQLYGNIDASPATRAGS